MRFAAAVSFVGWLCFSVLAPGISSPLVAEDGKLESIRREVETPDSSSDDDTPSRGGGPSFRWSSNCDDDSNSFTGQFVFMALTSPWWIPHSALEGSEGGIAEFSTAPYATHDGYLSINEQRTGMDGWSGRISLDNGSNFDDITSLSGRLRLDTTYRFGIDSEWVWLRERLPVQDDNLVRGDANVVIRFAQSERAQFHSGIGFNWLSGSGNPDFGFNFTYGADFFPVDPVVISTTLDLGNIGHSSLVHFRGTLGMMVLKQLHLYSGYDMLNFGGKQIHSLISGIELWF